MPGIWSAISRGVFAELAHSDLPERGRRQCLAARPLRAAARAAASRGNRYSPDIGDGTDIYGSEGTIHIASETLNPFHAAPLAVYTEKAADDLPDVLREAHYPGRLVEELRGRLDHGQAAAPQPLRAQLAAFCASIREGRPAPITGEDGLKAQELVQGAYLSMRDGRLGRPAARRRRALPRAELLRPPMRSCLHSVGLPDLPVLAACAAAAAAGYRGVELNAETLPWAGPHVTPATPADARAAIVAAAGRLDLALPALGAHIGMVDADPAARRAALAFVLGCIDLAADLGAPVVHVLSGPLAAPGGSREQAWGWFADAVAAATDHAGRAGIALGVEAIAGHLFHGADDYHRLARDLAGRPVPGQLRPEPSDRPGRDPAADRGRIRRPYRPCPPEGRRRALPRTSPSRRSARARSTFPGWSTACGVPGTRERSRSSTRPRSTATRCPRTRSWRPAAPSCPVWKSAERPAAAASP